MSLQVRVEMGQLTEGLIALCEGTAIGPLPGMTTLMNPNSGNIGKSLVAVTTGMEGCVQDFLGIVVHLQNCHCFI